MPNVISLVKKAVDTIEAENSVAEIVDMLHDNHSCLFAEYRPELSDELQNITAKLSDDDAVVLQDALDGMFLALMLERYQHHMK